MKRHICGSLGVGFPCRYNVLDLSLSLLLLIEGTREHSADFLGVFLVFFDDRIELLAQYYCLRTEVYHNKGTDGLVTRKG